MSRAPGDWVLRTVGREGMPHAYVSRLGHDGTWFLTWEIERARRFGEETAHKHARRISAMAAPRFQVEVVAASHTT